MKKFILYSLLLFSCVIAAQKKDNHLPKGNTEFAEKDYADAEAEYRISHSKEPKKATSSYNLGNSIYKQNQVSEAKAPYLKAIETARTHPQKHYAYHNLGNVYMKEKKYSEAVEAYKNALRNNPSDEETRYNYALAKKFLKDNPPPKDKKDKKDDKKDKKDKDKKDENKKDQDKKDDKKEGDKDKKDEPKDQGKNDQDKKGDEPKDNGQPKPQPGGISKQRLENLLEAVNNEEKKVQEKVNAAKVKGKPVKTEKDW